MERAIGSVFEHGGKWYRVEESKDGHGCIGCAFFPDEVLGCKSRQSELPCVRSQRTDRDTVIFVSVPPPNSTDLRFTLVDGKALWDCEGCALPRADCVMVREVLGLPDCGGRIYTVSKIGGASNNG